MSDLKGIKTRLAHLITTHPTPVVEVGYQQLQQQQYQAVFSAQQIAKWTTQFQLSPVELALQMLPLAACYARVPVSNFYVGAIAIAESGAAYFGANQEFAENAIQQTVHAEQSAVSYAWLFGEQRLTDIVVNYTPCGHCRQFMNETNNATQLQVHLPHRQRQHLHHYLPDAFGPKDLGIQKVLFDEQDQHFQLETADKAVNLAVKSASQSHAPYSGAFSGVA